MNKKTNEMYILVNNLMQASNDFDVKQYEEIIHELEKRIGKEVDRKDETKMELELAKNVKETILNTLDGEATLDMISTVEQIVTQAGAEYRALKTRYMNEGVGFFIDHIGIEDTDTETKTDGTYAEMQNVLDRTEKDDRGK